MKKRVEVGIERVYRSIQLEDLCCGRESAASPLGPEQECPQHLVSGLFCAPLVLLIA